MNKRKSSVNLFAVLWTFSLNSSPVPSDNVFWNMSNIRVFPKVDHSTRILLGQLLN